MPPKTIVKKLISSSLSTCVFLTYWKIGMLLPKSQEWSAALTRIEFGNDHACRRRREKMEVVIYEKEKKNKVESNLIENMC